MKDQFPVFIVFISLFTFFSCGENVDCDCDLPIDIRSITAEEEITVASANDFALDIFARINTKKPNSNLFISPFSISAALSMTANGAVGVTKNGIKKTLHQEYLTDKEINEAYKTLVEFVTELDPKVTMKIANSNWYNQEYNIKKEFKNILLDFYNAEVKATDFNNPGTKDQINGWIEDKTNGKIKDMIDKIPEGVVMYLINAIYFKSTWQYQFEKDKTKKMDFFLADGSAVQSDMMFSEGVKANFFANETLQYIELPYGNGQFVFSILLPSDASKLDETINNLDIDQLNSFIEGANASTFQVYLPKFKIKYKINLNDMLSAMGMEQSFSGNPDFSDLFVEELPLAISGVLHQSFLEVDEEGTEAAAATVVEITLTSVGSGAKPAVLNINKPFAFFIRERHSKAILFSGKLVDPTM